MNRSPSNPRTFASGKHQPTSLLIHISVVDFVRTLAERTTANGVLKHTLPL